jgi:hypothetical protein
MKNYVPAAIVFAGLFLVNTMNSSCSKKSDSTTEPKEQLIVRKWSINRIQLRLYYNGVFSKDTIIPQTPMPENFVSFDATGNFEYRFNTSTSDIGTYQFVGADSVISNVTTKVYRWKMLTLTDEIFTVMNTSTSPSFPGATVETYQTFVK